MTRQESAAGWAAAQVALVRDDPAGRMALLSRTYHGPLGRAPRHLPFRRAALSFMHWQAERGVLRPADGNPPGSRWWRAVNEQLLLDGCEAMARSGGLLGEASSAAIGPWMSFITRPTPRSWYRAHNVTIVSAYLEHVIGPRIQALYDWSARELGLPGLRGLVRSGSPIYAWSYADRHVWEPAHESLPLRLLRRATSPR